MSAVEQMELEQVRGSTEPRLFPAPLRPLTRATTYGFAVIDFARDVLHMPLDPWQEWLVIHAGELLPDGRPRFRKILVIVARQNGKTTLLKVLTLYWLFVECWRLIVGQSTTVALAREVWSEAQELAQDVPELAAEFGKVKLDNNDPHWRTALGTKYRPAAANRKGARGGSIDRLIVDELREHQTWEAYNAAVPTMNARPMAQAWFITNQGDTKGIVLASLRKTGVANIESTEVVDPELALFEWSAPPGSSMTDVAALCAANPNAGHRLRVGSLLADAQAALESGDVQRITGFKTEIMCMYVPQLDAAIDPAGWEAGLFAAPPDLLPSLRSRLALVPELSPDRLHASLNAAVVMEDGKVRVEVLHSWSGMNAARDMRRALPGWVRKVKPRKVGWLPNGPMAAMAAELVATPGRFPPGVEVEEIRGEVSAVCMGFAELVAAGDVLHSGQELLTKQVLGSAKLWSGDTWRYSRKGDGHCDTVYGVAAAAHLARTMPPGAGRPRLVIASD